MRHKHSNLMCILIIPFQTGVSSLHAALQLGPAWLIIMCLSFLCVQVNLCLLQASVEEGSPSCTNKCVTHVSLVALCFDRIATQFRMNRYHINYSVCSDAVETCVRVDGTSNGFFLVLSGVS